MYIPESFCDGNELAIIFDGIIKAEKIKATNLKNFAVRVLAISPQPQQILKQSTNLPVIVNSLTSKSDQSISLVTSSNNNNQDKNANNVVHRLISYTRGCV